MRRHGGAPREPRWLVLKFPAPCKVCGALVPAGGPAFYDYRAKTVTCAELACCEADGLTRQEWHGSPVSGRHVTVRAEHRIGEGYRTYKQRNGRCEDAPCCGCCE